MRYDIFIDLYICSVLSILFSAYCIVHFNTNMKFQHKYIARLCQIARMRRLTQEVIKSKFQHERGCCLITNIIIIHTDLFYCFSFNWTFDFCTWNDFNSAPNIRWKKMSLISAKLTPRAITFSFPYECKRPTASQFVYWKTHIYVAASKRIVNESHDESERVTCTADERKTERDGRGEHNSK